MKVGAEAELKWISAVVSVYDDFLAGLIAGKQTVATV